MPKWYTLFEDNSTGYSTMRVCLLVIVLTVMFNWTYVCMNKQELVPLDTNMMTLIVGFAGAKAVQRFGENGKTTEIVVEPTKTITTTTVG